MSSEIFKADKLSKSEDKQMLKKNNNSNIIEEEK